MYDFENMDKRYIIFGNIFLVANRLQIVMDKCANELTSKQWFVITMLEMFETPPTLKELAGVCNSSHQNIKQIILKLEKKGFLKIEKDSKDLRAMRISKTKECERWSQENNEFAQEFINVMFSDLSKEEIGTLNIAQQKIYDRLEKMKAEVKNEQ